VRHGVCGTLLAALVVASGCADLEPQAAPPLVVREAPARAYDATLSPAAAVLALVPEAAATLTVTDFAQLQKELGVELTDGSTPEAVSAFWRRAAAERPMLTTGMLRPADHGLAASYGFTQVDVAWEAHFYDRDDQELGWVLRFRDGTDMAPEAVSLAGPAANATYVARGCTPSSGAASSAVTGEQDIDALAGYGIEFDGGLVTARLGRDRTDLFTRMRLGETDPAFAAAYDGGAADPRTGRIGYVMTDPAAAARLALHHDLPFASCA
jgi:hypothetical protein